MAKPPRYNSVPQQPLVRPYEYRRGRVYGTHNPIDKGYAVKVPDISPSGKAANGRMVNQRGQIIDFWIEDIEANFEMAGQSAQSRKLRQFFPHNMVQPTVTVTGIAPNSHQYNRLAAFVRVSQYDSLQDQQNLEALNQAFRTVTDAEGHTSMIKTVSLYIGNGTEGNAFNIRNGRNLKGVHKSWRLEGYINNMAAGAERYQQAPPFQFNFVIAESISRPKYPNLGIWNDSAVVGDQIRSWMDIFKQGKGHFVHEPKPQHTNQNARYWENILGNVGDLIEDVTDLFGQ